MTAALHMENVLKGIIAEAMEHSMNADLQDHSSDMLFAATR